MKKIIYLIPSIIILFILAFYIGNIFRNYYIFTKINESFNNFSNADSLYIKVYFGQDSTTQYEYMQYNEKSAQTVSEINNTTNENNLLYTTYFDSNDYYDIQYNSNTVTKNSGNSLIISYLPTLPYSSETNNSILSSSSLRWQYSFSLGTRISSKTYNGIDCYAITLLEYDKMYPDRFYTIFVDKNTFIPIYINDNGTETFYEIKTNTINEDDFNFPLTTEELENLND